jgi:hypothetical protein
MAHRKICNAITVTKHYIMKNFPAVKKLWSVLSIHLLNSLLQSLPHMMTSEKEISIMRTTFS